MNRLLVAVSAALGCVGGSALALGPPNLFPLQQYVAPGSVASTIFPVYQGMTPGLITVPIPATAGTVVVTPSFINSDGSAFGGTVSVSGDPLFTATGGAVVLARATTSLDQNTNHTATVTATEPGPVPAAIKVVITPSTGTIACDIGPPVNAIPSEAQAAGLTHCAMNIDFAQPLYQNLNNWANCNYFSSLGPNPSNIWYFGSAGIKDFPPCGVYQVFDPQVGHNVMDFHWDPIENGNMGGNWTSVGQSNQVGFGTWNQAVNNFSGAATWTVGNFYLEDIVRLKASFTESVNAGGPDDVYMFGTTDPQEFDIPEFQTNQLTDLEGAVSGVAGVYAPCAGSSFCSTNWGPNPFVGVPGYTTNVYHTYGGLKTSDGATDIRACAFLDDIMQGPQCGPILSGGVTDTNFNVRSAVYVSAGSNIGNAQNPIDFYVDKIRIWTCAGGGGLGGGQCNGTTLQTSITPNGQTKTYYSGAH
jgi:hypothetical protein